MVAALITALLAIAPLDHEGDAQAITALVDVASGRTIADGRYAQWVAGDVLHIEARYDFPDGRTVVERAEVRLHPQLEQQAWSWVEHDGRGVVREYTVDFRTGNAEANRADQKKRWKEHLDIEPGKTFAGIAFVAVIKAVRAEVEPGQKIELKAVAFTSKPRIAPVEVIREKAQTLSMAGRKIAGDRWTIHPDIPAVAKIFVKAPDQHVWLFATGPAAFLRYEGPLAEPDDPVIRVDLIPARSANAGRRPRR